MGLSLAQAPAVGFLIGSNGQKESVIVRETAFAIAILV
jgi:hypothetical protein